MQIKGKEQREVEVVRDVLCNRCGGTCVSEQGSQYGLSATVEGGYESTHLEDLVAYHFDLCEKCLSELFAQFKIPPDRTGAYLQLEPC